ncbi:unnamed protein product [Fraxinus pennsylvanica]|uniref:TF-B3 domain-containing protein n=1 Tax=Fraxinus pennsylvanica TaxID=56036 RepID=A0AAD1ZVQ5_9LAMI|nr:unnamed protein product [Fraxinus pennsylvanica]
MIKGKDLKVEQELQSGNEVRMEEMMAVINPNNSDAMEVDHHLGEKDLWLDDGEQENLLDLNDTTIFYNDFPPLPDFPCMSSSSSSSSTQEPKKTITITAMTSSSSASSASLADSFAVLKSDAEEDTYGRGKFHKCDQLKPEPTALSSTASMDIPPPSDDAIGDVDCINVMENFGYMDLIDNNEIWDPSTVFQSENPQEYLENQQVAAGVVAPPLEGSQHVQKKQNQEEENEGFSFLQGNSELAMIFFEWLKHNKDHISAEDMRNIKLKRSTIESASKRLGSNKEGKKQLLKLILEWVEQYQLQKKRLSGSGGGAGPQSPYQQYQEPDFDPNPNSNFNYNSVSSDPNACFSSSPWIAAPPPPPPLPYVQDSSATMVAAPPTLIPPPSSSSYGDPYSNGVPVPIPLSVNPPANQVINGIPYPCPADYQMMEHAQSWPSSQFPISSTQYNPFLENGYIPQGIPQHQAVYNRNPYQIFDTNGERLVRLDSSATKEARKKRMARQKRLYPHHHRHQNQHHNQTNVDQHAVDGRENVSQGSSSANWMYWSPPHISSPSTGGMLPSSDASQGHTAGRPSSQQQSYQRQASSNRMLQQQQQSWKTEKNLKFLLQKVLKQSDVGNLGRIVLPKKEAETHLPELESRDGISISMEDIGSSRVWNMRYRFWPNNKSRMYLLENTGDFVRVNGLQEGDFIVIYSDTKCGKYMIRGVKVRQPGAKLEGKKPARRNMRNFSGAGHGPSSLAFTKRAVR